jgi:hypothetical protein
VVRTFDFVDDLRDAERDDLQEFSDGGGSDDERKREFCESREIRDILEAALESCCSPWD